MLCPPPGAMRGAIQQRHFAGSGRSMKNDLVVLRGSKCIIAVKLRACNLVEGACCCFMQAINSCNVSDWLISHIDS